MINFPQNTNQLDFTASNVKRIIEHIFSQLSTETETSSWASSIQISINRDNNYLLIQFPHKFFANWFHENIKKEFERIFYNYFDADTTLEYTSKFNFNKENHNSNNRKYKSKIEYEQDPDYSFDNFIVNKKNYFPYISSKEISQQNDINYNPFFLIGNSGTGKTHLLKAIANEFVQQFSNYNILFATIEDLHSIYQTKKNNRQNIRNYLCSFESFILDDFQEIDKFEYLQQELILIFNFLHKSKKQMIFGCNGKLACLEGLDPKLKSRLEWGLIVQLKNPDLDIRLQYVKKQSKKNSLCLTQEQILHLAQRFQNIRHLRGIIIKLLAYRELIDANISDANFKDILKDLEIKPKQPLDAAQIMRVVADYHQIEPEDLKSSKRHHSIVLARQSAMFLCRKLLGYSYPQLGILFGGKDHSTAIYSIKKIQKLQDNNKDIKNMLTTLKQKCRSLSEQVRTS